MSEPQAAQDMALERILLWQDFTQPQGYRDTLTLVRMPKDNWLYELKAGGTVSVMKYNHFWKRLE